MSELCDLWWVPLVVSGGLLAWLVHTYIDARRMRDKFFDRLLRKRQSTYIVLRGIAEGVVAVRIENDNLIVRKYKPDGGYKDKRWEYPEE